jgi:hypothetical protein
VFSSDTKRACGGFDETAGATFGLAVFGIVASPEFGSERQRAAWINKPSELVFLDAKRLDIK